MPWVANVGEGAAEQWAETENTVCISISEPDRKVKLPKFMDVIREQFQDYDKTARDGKTPRKFPESAVFMSPTQAARIARFARKHRDEGRNILVHCAAGISRSGAIAESLLQAFPEYEDRGWLRHPNNHVRCLMKRALGLIPLGAEEDADV
jgi:predicted protein tyrosine phosphatase